MDDANNPAIDAETGLEKRDVARARLLGAIPRLYNPWLHLAGTLSVGVIVIVLAAVKAHHVRPSPFFSRPASSGACTRACSKKNSGRSKKFIDAIRPITTPSTMRTT